ncbi:MAG: DUF456 domain-containing protein [Phycisphaeraceae bacterium]|nr:DUF456 domain-containing protein [Phycisphaeraceae bacterium]
MFDPNSHFVVWALLIALVIANGFSVFLVLLQLPGTWIMLALTVAAAWWRWDHQTISGLTLTILLVMALVGELIEFFAGSWGARRVGGSKRAAVLAIVGGIVGALIGTFFIPIPLFGTLIGACLGAGICSLSGDMWAGRSWSDAWRTGKGAALGKFAGTIAKVGIAAAMWVIVTAALVI